MLRYKGWKENGVGITLSPALGFLLSPQTQLLSSHAHRPQYFKLWSET